MALVFGVLTLTLVSNQVATGLALTLFGLGLSALVGSGLRRLAGRSRCRSSPSPASSTIPVLGPVLFDQDVLVYLSVALTLGVAWFLKRTRGGMILRACGELRRLRPLDRLRRDPHPLHRGPVRRRCARASAALSCRSPTRRCGSRT